MLRVEKLGHHYRGGPWLFRNVDFAISPGEVVAVLGPNARGKTTMLTCMAGVRTPVEGQIITDGVIGYVPQSHSQNHQFTVYDMVLMGRARKVGIFSAPNEQDGDLTWEALERVGIDNLANRNYGELSGGQRQLTLIARSLVAQPSTLILDEPTSALDLRNQRQVLHIIEGLAAEGMAIVYTTHDPTHAFYTSTTTIVMEKDEVTVGSTAAQLTAERLNGLYRTPIVVRDVNFSKGTKQVVLSDLTADME